MKLSIVKKFQIIDTIKTILNNQLPMPATPIHENKTYNNINIIIFRTLERNGINTERKEFSENFFIALFLTLLKIIYSMIKKGNIKNKYKKPLFANLNII